MLASREMIANTVILPEQVLPSPSNPELHAHAKLELAKTHWACLEQMFLLSGQLMPASIARKPI